MKIRRISELSRSLRSPSTTINLHKSLPLERVMSQSMSQFLCRFAVGRRDRFPTLVLLVGEAPLQQDGCQLPWAHVSAQAGKHVRLRLQFLPHMFPERNESADRRRRIGRSTAAADQTALQFVQQRHHAERPVRSGYDWEAPRRAERLLQIVGLTSCRHAPSRPVRLLGHHPALRSMGCGHCQLPSSFKSDSACRFTRCRIR
jgi:hypothetical protein